MTNKEIRKYQFGKWSRKPYKAIRRKIRFIMRRELEIPQDIQFK